MSDDALLSRYVYTLDKVGNRTAVGEVQNGQSRNIAYTYDDLYRLTGEVITDATNGNRTSGYVYDAVGNRLGKTVNGTTTTYTYDLNDRLLNEKVNNVITTSYGYDNNGSTLTKTENGVTTTYVWNDEKRLVATNVNGTQVEYGYNDQGIRVSSKVNGVETRYLLDEGAVAQVWEEYAIDETVQATYVYGDDLISQTQTNQTSYYLVDGLGSTRLLTNAQGVVLNDYRYDAFGETTSQTGTMSNKYQFAGEQFDSTLGDYYLRQRFYDTSSGRFLRKDTYEGGAGDLMNLNQYVYAGNNPVNYGDPTGLFSGLMSELKATEVIGGILAVIGAVGTYITYQPLTAPVAEAVVGAFARAMETSLSMAENLNRLLRIPVVVWGNDLPETTQHQFKALTGSGYTFHNPRGDIGQSRLISPILMRTQARQPRGRWYYNYDPCQGTQGAGTVCDEYPYATTVQGGRDNFLKGIVSIHPVPAWEQTLRGDGQGGRLGTFYTRAEVIRVEDPNGLRNSLFINLAFPFLGFSFWIDRNMESHRF